MVKLDIQDNIALLTLNNPEKRNMLTPEMSENISRSVEEVEANKTIRALIVTGAGKAFCAGGRLDDLQPDEATLQSIYRGFLSVANCSIPTIAAVNGAAVGAGFNLAVACDVRVVTQKARLIPGFFRLGLHPGGGNTWMMRQLANWETAAGMLLFSQTLVGEDAVTKGLAWKCVSDDKLLEEAFSLTDEIRRLPREILVNTKQTLREAGIARDHNEVLKTETKQQIWCLEQPYAKSAIASIKADISQSK